VTFLFRPSLDDSIIARQYFWLGIIAALMGAFLSLLMRVHIVWPELALPLVGFIKPETYLGFMTIHATLMVFFVVVAVPQNGFGSLLAGRQVGATRGALPLLNATGLWLTVLSLLVLLASFFVAGSAPQAGWTQYPPLSALPEAAPGQALGMDLWLVSILLFCLAITFSSMNTLFTVLWHRGMPLMQMPLSAWAWLVNSVLILLAFTILGVAGALLFSDRHLGTSFFFPAELVVNGEVIRRGGAGSPLLWQHLFWFFGHPVVYIAILPAMGMISQIIATFSGRTIWSYRGMVASTFAIGVLGFAVWGHHMFTSGMHPMASFAFSSLTMAVAVPSSVKLVNWLATLWHGHVRLESPMLFALGFISLFITGGLTGPILAQPALDSYLHDTYFVVAHFHLIMAMAVLFAIFAATYYWFPQLSGGRRMNESLARLHFWFSFIGAYCTFMPMHFLGIAGHPRRYSQLLGSAEYLQPLAPMQMFITISAIGLMSAQAIFLYNLVRSWRGGELAGPSPWGADTLEWMPSRQVAASK
jgi:cytochrome c oxidase subunit I